MKFKISYLQVALAKYWCLGLYIKQAELKFIQKFDYFCSCRSVYSMAIQKGMNEK